MKFITVLRRKYVYHNLHNNEVLVEFKITLTRHCKNILSNK